MTQTIETASTLQLSSTAFDHGGTIPQKYAGQGDGISPPLSWTAGPPGVQSYALIMEDPDAPLITFTHWVIFNIPAGTRNLPENVAADETLADGTRQGKNTLFQVGYTPPRPPTKKPHRYYFRLYALDALLELEAGASKADLTRAMEGHIRAQGELIGIYQRH